MSDLLFDIPESKSPKLLWLETHCDAIIYDRHRKRFVAMAAQESGWGDTEDDAITQLAMRLGVRLWNETEEPI